MERKQKDKRKEPVLIAIIVISLVLSGYFAFDYLTIIEIEELDTYLTIGEVVGFNFVGGKSLCES